MNIYRGEVGKHSLTQKYYQREREKKRQKKRRLWRGGKTLDTKLIKTRWKMIWETECNQGSLFLLRQVPWLAQKVLANLLFLSFSLSQASRMAKLNISHKAEADKCHLSCCFSRSSPPIVIAHILSETVCASTFFQSPSHHITYCVLTGREAAADKKKGKRRPAELESCLEAEIYCKHWCQRLFLQTRCAERLFRFNQGFRRN